MCSRYSYNEDEAKLRLRDKIIRVIRGSMLRCFGFHLHLIPVVVTLRRGKSARRAVVVQLLVVHPPKGLHRPTGLTGSPVKHSLTA
jgi:hypothetical protein